MAEELNVAYGDGHASPPIPATINGPVVSSTERSRSLEFHETLTGSPPVTTTTSHPASFQHSLALSEVTDSMATMTMRSQPLEQLMAAGAMPSFKGQARSVVDPNRDAVHSNAVPREYYQTQQHYVSHSPQNSNSSGSPTVIATRDDAWYDYPGTDARNGIPVVEAYALPEETHPEHAVVATSTRGSGHSGSSGRTRYSENGRSRVHTGQTMESNDDSKQERRNQQLRTMNYALSILMGLILLLASLTGVVCFAGDCRFGRTNAVATPTNPQNEQGQVKHQKTGHTMAFTTTEELYRAVDVYMTLRDDRSSHVALQYGYPMSAWNVSLLSNFSNVFDGKRNPNLVSTFDEDLSGWDVSSAVDMFRAFASLRHYTGRGLEDWNVEKVTNLRSMFSEAYKFQGNISGWSVSKAVFLKRMFSDSLFNVDISNWDVSNVEDLGWMFYECSEFNQDLSRWNVRKVKDFAEMFGVARSFNSNLSGWNVENAVTMEGMFERAFSFNQNLSSWDVRQVDNLFNMFNEAREFNQSLCAWGEHLNPNANVTSMFRTTKCFNMTDPVLNSVNSFVDGPICYPC